jgi:hypothetical protein
MMSETAKTIQNSNAGVVMPLLKVLLSIAAIALIGFWAVTKELPNATSFFGYFWVTLEFVVAILLIPVVITNLKRIFGGKR